MRADAIDALASAFAFDARALSQRVTEAEVLTELQAVDGVVGARVTKLAHVSEQGGDVAAAVGGILAAQIARWDAINRVIRPAELLTIHPAGVIVTATVAP